ncbi:hypothetical protein [Nocardioides sp. B-3]|uniref:hypothetical protein n=1 Tax=Nocardioides sp. B-3 TaxID=2895565 RepID=UPI0021536322|nr:hypothetical protein [Nocardioides sp. B-3]UUZ61956.1 hypothetical protein LP418_13660 [Nocardioides sp. B-3]
MLSITLLGYFLGSAFPSPGEQIDKLIIIIPAFSLIPIARGVVAPQAHQRPRGAGQRR